MFWGLQPIVAKKKPKRYRATGTVFIYFEQQTHSKQGRNKITMNIEIANRLVNLRKEKNLSQEALAEKLGISRQAVSKWERAEASPDTDNLILLARLYGVSLDELLQTEDEIPRAENETVYDESEGTEEGTDSNGQDSSKEYVHIGLGGIHVKDKDGTEVHVGWNGIHVDEKKNNNKVNIDKEGVYINGEKQDRNWVTHHHHFPILVFVIAAYLILGICLNAWHPGWLILFLIPLVQSLIEAICRKNANIFAYPVLALGVFFALGIFKDMWHPGWAVFLTVPVYYSLAAYIQGLRKKKSGEPSEWAQYMTGQEHQWDSEEK